MNRRPYDIPLEITVVEGEVVIIGPDGVAASLTPRAARASAVRLSRAADAAEARAQDDADLLP